MLKLDEMDYEYTAIQKQQRRTLSFLIKKLLDTKIEFNNMHVRELCDQIKRTFNITIRSTEKLRALKLAQTSQLNLNQNDELEADIETAFKKSTN